MTALSVTVTGVIDSYAALVEAITEETDGRANTAAIDRFIKQAEGEIQVFLARNPVRPMRTRSSLVIDDEYVASPTDMVKPINVEAVNGTTKFRVPHVAQENLSAMQARAAYDNQPYAFTREGDDLRFYPAPTQVYSGTLFYYAKLPGISSANTTNWLLSEYPHIYLAGALYYAYRDMPDIEKAGLMKGIFDEGLDRLSMAYPEADNEVTLGVDPAMFMGSRTWLPLN